ncbi:PTS cellobiose transporter subunit IIC [Streptococcus pseudoporcinus]|uniref:Permease IIC component n=1 Tax=Streptococcus pseudoporcinus TaxID=361101 RepID=A0A4U9XIW7_9STRE|nr:PTS cellobiose transporter subunit IIC [Streptococcus pseudoporcinus]VTS12926.1 PTS system transporter subunit IIC [Streptococcus pseudoporcinus]VUC66019.1 PTS system transporter subunit IIC [Streptococcus pseudoporcinus]VUC96946.1 PTS system transporter subunit IIC [Streptococcus pseudoporcinus]VUC97334.1 PTS system transporter subunit IIC [Streptococcus pseudoporcinus]
MFEFLEKYLMGPMGVVSTWRPVRAIVAAGMASIPLTIVGSAFLVLGIIPTAFPFSFVQDLWANSFDKIAALTLIAYKCSMGILTLYFAFVIGFEYTKIYAEEDGLNLDPMNGGLLSVFAFFMTVPEITFSKGAMALVANETTINGWSVGGDSLARLSTSGLFTGILMAVLTVQLYRLCVVKNWVVKMPDAVPEGVSRSFTALIPAFVVAVTVIFISGIFILFGTDIYKVIAIPFGFVKNITNSIGGIIVIYFLIHALWLVGIHGANIVMGLVNPILLANMAENVNGAHFAFAGEFTNAYVTIGGSGATLGVCIFMALFAKSEQLKMLGRASIGSSLFNINEPLIFGLPIVYNPFLAIPFLLSPVVTALVAFIVVDLNIVKKAIIQTPWPTPGGLGAYLASGDIKAAILAIVCVILAFLIWFPFIKYYDNKLLAEERAVVAESANL